MLLSLHRSDNSTATKAGPHSARGLPGSILQHLRISRGDTPSGPRRTACRRIPAEQADVHPRGLLGAVECDAQRARGTGSFVAGGEPRQWAQAFRVVSGSGVRRVIPPNAPQIPSGGASDVAAGHARCHAVIDGLLHVTSGCTHRDVADAALKEGNREPFSS